MSLKATIQNAVASASTALGDLVAEYTYKQITAGEYSTTTGSITPTETEHTIPMVRTEYDFRDVDGTKIQVGDLQLMVLDASLITFTPSTSDKIVVGGKDWGVVNYGQDPAEATWTFQVRR